MEPLILDKLAITHVSHHKAKFMKNAFKIKFEIEGYNYSLFAKVFEDGIVYPVNITHRNEDYGCKYCTGKGNRCWSLIDHQQEFFQRLITFPSVRLEWLYINHA